MARLSWDEYFMRITKLVAERSTCLRSRVGAIIVKQRHILATGYNGAPRGIQHCDQAGCLREKLKIASGQRHELCRGIHAEQNAIIQAAAFGVSIAGSTIYSTHHPCVVCSKMIINARIDRIVVEGDYPDPLAQQMLKEATVAVERIS
ncbi:MAG: cytidine/deoxycytidylate deaminase family protein [bacterium]